jgi:hypothetical protein
MKREPPHEARTRRTRARALPQSAGDIALEHRQAEFALLPNQGAARTIKQWDLDNPDAKLVALVMELSAQSNRANGGNLKRAEELLVNQAHALDAIFNNLARRAAPNAAQYLGACEVYLRLALKAQSQCRSTLETLAAVKNPSSVAFVRQANIAHGHQQVINAPPPAASSRAREPGTQPNELMEQQRNGRLDRGTARAAASSDLSLETVGAVNRTKDDRW